jgi:hypothetical protein
MLATVLDYSLDLTVNGKIPATRVPCLGAKTPGRARSRKCHHTRSPDSRASVRWDLPRPCARYQYRTRATRNHAKTAARVGCTTSRSIGATAPPVLQDLIVSWRTIALRDRARMEQNAPLKTILTSVRAPQGSPAQHVQKTSRNVQQPNPVCTDNASTHMDRMRVFANQVTRARTARWYTSRATRRRV